MKLTGRNIKRRLYGVKRLGNRMARARYFRGHGVHSPFVYGIVRQVFMCSRPLSERHDLYDLLLAMGVPRRRALQLQNLCVHCGYVTYAVDECRADADLIILTPHLSDEDMNACIASSREAGTTLAVLYPYLNRERERACRAVVSSHECTTVDNRGYLLVFNNHLPKQHFRL